jgi:hypothetical protein
MQDIINAFARPATIFKHAYVPANEVKPRPLGFRHKLLHFVEVVAMTGRKIIQPDHTLIQSQQSLKKIRADKASDAGYQPSFWTVDEFTTQIFVSCHCCLYSLETQVCLFRLKNLF